MYMGMEVEFEFAVPPIKEFTKMLVEQVDSDRDNLQKKNTNPTPNLNLNLNPNPNPNSNRADSVQKKRKELSEKIRLKQSSPSIQTTSYRSRDSSSIPSSNPSPSSSFISSQRSPNVTSLSEISKFEPLQRVVYTSDSATRMQSENSLDSSKRFVPRVNISRSSDTSNSLSALSPTTITSPSVSCFGVSSPQISKGSSVLPKFLSKGYAEEIENTHTGASTLTAFIRMNQLQTTPSRGDARRSSNIYDSSNEEPSFIRMNQLQTTPSRSDAKRSSNTYDSSSEETVATNILASNRYPQNKYSHSPVEESSMSTRSPDIEYEYVQEEFFWIIDYRGTEKTFDSDAFTFAGTRFRLSFSPNLSSSGHKQHSKGYSFLLALAQPHGRADVFCEFKVHGLLRPTFSRKCSKNLHFSSKSTVIRGFNHFMGPEIMSYMENGTFTLSVVMKTYLGPNLELLGIPYEEREIKVVKDRESDNNDSEVTSIITSGDDESSSECRIDQIYQTTDDSNEYFSSKTDRILRMRNTF